MQTQHFSGGLAITALWEAKPGHADTVAGILGQFVSRAREEPGVKLFLVHRAAANPGQFLFYELFDDKAAFAAHQETPHFRNLILNEALPLLSRRERTEYSLL